MQKLLSIFAPPTFEDEEKNRAARTLYIVLLISVLAAAGFLLIGLSEGINQVPIPIVVLFGINLLALWLAKRGQLLLPAIFVPLNALLALTATILSGSGFHHVGLMGFLLVVIVATLLLGKRGTIAFGILSLLVVLAVGMGEINGRIVNEFSYATNYVGLGIVAVELVASWLILYVLVHNFTASVNRERQNLESLIQTNQELEQLKASLENRVAERTQELAEAQYQTQSILAELDEASHIARLANYELELPSQTLIFNDRFYELLGTSVRTIGSYRLPVEQAVRRFIHPEDAPRILEDIQVVGTGPTHGEVEYRMLHQDGRILTFSFRFIVETDESGQLTLIKGAVQDITERKQAEAALRETEDIYRRAIASADAVPYSRLYNGETFTFMGEKIYEMTGYTAEEITPAIFDSIVEETIVHTTSLSHAEAVQQARLGQATNWRADYRLRTRDGRSRWISDNSIEIMGLDGKSTGSVGIMLDITERKQAESTLAQQAAELETVTELATAVASISDPTIMLQTVVDRTQASFNLYHAHIYQLNEVGDLLELAVGSGEAGRAMTAQKHTIPLNRDQSLVARAARTRQAVVVNDVSQNPAFLPNPMLPDTCAELAVPIIANDDLLGVLDVQSEHLDFFTDEETRIQTILAAQIGIALQNARAKAQTAQTLDELNAFTRRLTREGWQDQLDHRQATQLGYMLVEDKVQQLSGAPPLELIRNGGVIKPIMVGGEPIGQMVAAEAEMDEAEVDDILAAISQGLSAHLENLRLNEQTERALAEAQRRTEELALINQIVAAVSATIDIQESLQIVVNEIVKATSADQARFLLLNEERTKLTVLAEHSITQSILGLTIPVVADPLAAKVLDSRQTQQIDDPQHDPLLANIHHIMQAQKIEQLVIIPLAVGNVGLGTLALEVVGSQERRITPDELRLAETLVFQVATAIQNARLFEQVQSRARQEQILREVTARVYTAPDAESVLKTAAQEISRILDMETLVYLENPQVQTTNGHN